MDRSLTGSSRYPTSGRCWRWPRIHYGSSRESPRALQDLGWSCGFAAFAVLCGACGLAQQRREPSQIETETATVRASESIPWLLLAAAGSMMLVSTTNQLTQNVAAVPFLWILPLGVYLLSFIICFESPRWYQRGLFLRLLAIALGSLAYALYDVQVSVAIVVAIPLFTLGCSSSACSVTAN